MTHASVLATLLIATLFYQGGGLAVPTKITAKPPDSFSRGNSVTFQATFAANRIPPIKAGPCQYPGFAIRLYDAKLVENEEGPRITPDTTHLNDVKPVTPYIQESVAPFEPLSGPNALTIEKTFEPLKFPAKKTARLKRIYIGLFRTCDLATPKDIDETLNIIYDDALSGSYIGGSFFKLECPKGSMCIYRPE